MVIVAARATAGPGEPFGFVTIKQRDVGPRDILVDIACVGIWHSDIAYAHEELGNTLYPLAPRHEITGSSRSSAPGHEVRCARGGDDLPRVRDLVRVVVRTEW